MGLFNLSHQQVARLVSRTVYKNLYQDIVHKDGFGITDRFVRPEQTKAAMVDIYVPIPLNGRFRMRGAETNGLWANTRNLPDASNGQRRHVLSKRFTIDILKRYDENIAISEDEVEGVAATSLDEGFEQICREQIEQDIAINVNGYTFATQIYQFFMDSFSATPTAEEVTKAIELFAYDAADKSGALLSYKLANAKVSNGDSKLFAGFFPADARQAFIWDTTYLVYLSLPATNHAADIAAKMVAGGGMNAFTNEKKTVADFESGYVGWADGIPIYSVLQQIKDATWYYMGLNPANANDALTIQYLSQLSCLICPSNATIRGLRPTSFKTVDDPDVQGVIIQPKVNMGVRCLSGNSLKAVFSGAGFKDATTALASVTSIRAGIAGRLVLPNMDFDRDPAVNQLSVLTTTAAGTQSMTANGVPVV